VRSELTQAIKRFGLGILNLTIAIALYIAVVVIARGHLSAIVLPIVGAVIMAAAYIGGSRLIEDQRLTEFAGAGGIREFAGGLSLGFCLFSAVMVLLWPVSVYHPVGWVSVAHDMSG
jgi:hypothetical protein